MRIHYQIFVIIINLQKFAHENCRELKKLKGGSNQPS